MVRIPGSGRLPRLPQAERRVAGEVEDEIAFHVEERTRELTERGMDPGAARAQALREFGDVREARAELEAIGRSRVRHRARADWWSDLRQDGAYAWRGAVKAPLFTLAAVATLALGIGANAAIFGVVKSVLIDALPYGEPDRLLAVSARYEGAQGVLSAGSVQDIRERQRSFERMTAFAMGSSDVVVGSADGPRIGQSAWVEPEFFRTLGVAPFRGRSFEAGDAATDTARVVMLTHGAWQRLFAGDPEVIGSDVAVNGIQRTVVGILPAGFIGPVGEADFYFAMSLEPTLQDPVRVRRRHWLGMVGRLNPGVAPEAAQRELEVLGEQLVAEHPHDNAGMTISATSLREALAGRSRTPLLLLLASAGLVLLIACANLAGALLSRTLTRRKEFAVRVALGAARGRLVRQLLTESTLIAVFGGAVGVLLAALSLSAMRGLALPGLPEHAKLTMDAGVVVVAGVLALFTGIVFGVAPAVSVGRWDPQPALREESRGASAGPGASRLRGMLVAGQIALCVSLLAGAGLLTRSLMAITSTPLGFDGDRVLTTAVHLPARDYPGWQDQLRFHEQLEERIASLPGAASVALAGELPTRIGESVSFTIDGVEWPTEGEPFVLYTNVSGGYFATLGIPLLEGRIFDRRDHPDAPSVVIISQAMARRYWAGGSAVGSRIRMGPDREAPLIEVIGVVGDVRNDPASAESSAIAYRPVTQDIWSRMSFLIRTGGDPAALIRPIEREVAALGPGVPISRTMLMREVVGERLATRRFPALLISAFGLLALLLASVGVYALFSAMGAAREREFGVRMALGSSRASIAALVLRQGGAWMVAGLAGGVVGVVLVIRLLRDLLYGIAPFDPVALGSAVLILLLAAAVALLTPVRRATRVDPAAAMRAQ